MHSFFVLAIYLIGCVAGYLSLKFLMTHKNKKWTTGDRGISIMLGVLSWVIVLACFISFLIVKSMESDKPAKW